MEFNEERYPPQVELTGQNLMLIGKGVEEFKKLYADKYDLLKYEIWLNKFEEKKYFSISFLPNIETIFAGVHFEIADQGMYQNGPGVVFFFSLDDCSLLKTQWMR